MAYQARDIMADAATTLLDEDAVRWTAPELFGYLNDGLRAVAAEKPNAYTQTVTLTLVSGTLQTLPGTYRALSRVTRNLLAGHDEEGGPIGGNAITDLPNTRQLDALIPNWQSNTALFSSVVRHVIYDLADTKRFYVVPGNTGGGKIEAVVLANPGPMTAPVADTDKITSYTATIPLGDEYKNALRDYVLARAYSKDAAVPGAAARAAGYAEMFARTMQSLAAGETGTSLATKAT